MAYCYKCTEGGSTCFEHEEVNHRRKVELASAGLTESVNYLCPFSGHVSIEEPHVVLYCPKCPYQHYFTPEAAKIIEEAKKREYEKALKAVKELNK